MIPFFLLSTSLFLILWWAYFGYFIFLAIAKLCKQPGEKNDKLDSYPNVAFIVCCKNESALVEEKLKNTLLLDYPKDKITIYFVDGQSTDDTVQKLTELAKEFCNVEIHKSNITGKINQLNFILPKIQSELIVNSDMDAELIPNTITELVKEFSNDPYVSVAGAMVIPKNACIEEIQYWHSQNKVRLLESDVYSSSIVIAPCYMFKKDLIESFPYDVVADDIYIANLATIHGKRVVYCKDAIAYETRTPKSVNEMFIHKFRKTNAYITEILRFMHFLPQLNLFWKVIFLTRALQLLGTPWILVSFGMLLLSLLSLGHISIVFLYFCIGVASLGITHLIIGKVDTGVSRKTEDFITSLYVFLTLTALLLLAGISYPFYRQNSQYKKL